VDANDLRAVKRVGDEFGVLFIHLAEPTKILADDPARHFPPVTHQRHPVKSRLDDIGSSALPFMPPG
jgi:hypothetical protein